VVIKTSLPYLPQTAYFSFASEGEAAFDELHGFFQGDRRQCREECVKVIGHHHKFMKAIFALTLIVEEDVYKQLGHPVRLEDCLFFPAGGGDKISAAASRAAIGDSHNVPQRPKPPGLRPEMQA
jgi:hypothetical protein